MNSSFFGFYAHAGFLKGLIESGIQPVAVSGASAGSLVAGLYAAGYSPEEMLGQFFTPELKKDMSEWKAWPRFLAILLGRRLGVLSGKKTLLRLRGLLGDLQIEDCKQAELAISIANLSAGKSELATTGSLAETMMASCAMPGMFAPQKLKRNGAKEPELYWDGGIADPIPFEGWINHKKIKRIIVHLVMPETKGGFHKFLSAIDRSHEIISDELFRLKRILAEQAGKEVIVVETRTPKLGPSKLHMGLKNAELGRESALKNFRTI
jgi:predicted acylesterase/phospholipase RssA